MSVRETIIEEINDILNNSDKAPLSNVQETDVLLDSGLDSLGFAILVAKLDETLGIDPFVEMEEAVYPKTFGEFFSIYEKHSKS